VHLQKVLIHIVVLAGLIVATRVVPHAQDPTLTVVDAGTHDPSRPASTRAPFWAS
jgi:hypothetical protein